MEDIRKGTEHIYFQYKKKETIIHDVLQLKKEEKKVQKEFGTIVNSVIQLRAGYECII